MLVADLPTPSLLIEKSRLEGNLAAVQARAEAEGVALRPHIKTHKCPDLARQQVEGGAQGLTVATIREAEAFAAAGFDDLVIAKEIVTEEAFRRIAGLHEQGVRLAFCIDTLAGAERASRFFAECGGTEVVIEVDTGYHRCGLRWDDAEAADVARQMAVLPGLQIRGLLTHGGQAYRGPADGETKRDARVRAMQEERDRLLVFAARLGAADMLDPATAVLSVGSTPTFSVFENAECDGFRITEVRPGNYVFHDAMQVALATCRPAACALTIQATVIAIHRGNDGTDRVFIDAGKKALSTDIGYGTAGYGVLLHSPRTMKPLPHARIVGLSEEHGWIEVPGGSTFEVGDRVRILPNHACVTVAMQDILYAVEGEAVVDKWVVVAR